mgnify:CR=1 FL=1
MNEAYINIMEQEKLTQRKQQALDTRRKIFNTALNLIKEKGCNVSISQ